MKSGWLNGRKGSVEGWFPEDFVMPVLTESSERWQRADDTEHQSADYVNIANSYYTNLPAQ